ncbi:hypothetical protein K474DRAFT_1568920, partial [Panus rudis PR-1116 ss-1]
ASKLLKLWHSRRARKLSLGTIQEIEDTLRSLQSSFVFPSQLDFDSPQSTTSVHSSDAESSTTDLAYTANNRPLRAYEHALNKLLERLDAVDSQGDLQVRGRRKEVVNEVERALKEMERKVEESRERS